MYKIKCDDYYLYNPRDEDLVLLNPKLKIQVNAVGECSFTIYNTHPYYDKMQKMKSIFEVSDEIGVLFRGRMTNETKDFYNSRAVDLEGLMAFFNDSIVAPFNFPNDFLNDPKFVAAVIEKKNIVELFLNWLIENHNSQVQEFQQFKLGNVTVSDPNNYLSRSDTSILSTWEVLKTKLFESALGGYLCIRYEADGNYIDYLSDFETTNSQVIEFGENLLDLKHDIDATTTYSVIVPIGAEIQNTDEDGNTTSVKVNLESISDGLVEGDIYKITLENGLHALYSQSAVEQYGWLCSPVADTTWADVTEVSNLLRKAVNYFSDAALLMADTIEVTAVDLHFTDEEIRSFRIYSNVQVESKPHGLSAVYKLTQLDIDLLNPQNTKITVGETKRTLTESIAQAKDGKDGKNGEDATTLRIDSSRGTVFKNSEVSTVLSAVIYRGSKRITDIDALHKEFGTGAYLEWSWQRMDDDAFGTILSTDDRIGNSGFTFTLSPSDVDTKVVFMCKLITD